ncbi:hypothetical protein [Pseudorhizobium flavum]|uniref:Uncharacterized protein (TIGR02646 family) n=1 Tax=Pseudorhizobium flavum TaxID=1335061 RepID=A0A7W9YTK0_9HYPH|nr:hypothetical protein [Pseudorhizobium flavum]MBB6178089.1 uncharacterized protein (TIGR02646 family) [Pseudorhizobium flavum]
MYRDVLRKYRRGNINWSDKALTNLRREIRVSLRAQQNSRCYFCRQFLYQERRNASENIEHFLDKSKPHYAKWSFSPVNLTLACHPCNMQKGSRDVGDAAVRAAISLRANSGSFRWIHPYFDDYHANIEIHPGWVYGVRVGADKPVQAQNLIQDLELHRIQTIVQRRQRLNDLMERTIIVLEKLIVNPNRDMARMSRVAALQRRINDDLRWA